MEKALDVRVHYQNNLYATDDIRDQDHRRSLTEEEMRSLHNAWMNDVERWMSPDCLQEYNALISEAEELESYGGKHKGKGRGKSKGKDKGRGKSKDDKNGSAEKPEHGPRQRAQQLKKQRFNKVINDIARNKGFFMTFVRHPAMLTAEGIMRIMVDLADLKKSSEYEKMTATSTKKTEAVLELKRKRETARLAVKRGKYDWDHWNQGTKFYRSYENGKLQEELEAAEAACGARNSPGVAHYLGPRMGDASF